MPVRSVANVTVGTSTLGERVRTARIAEDQSLRSLAKKLHETPSHLSDKENDDASLPRTLSEFPAWRFTRADLAALLQRLASVPSSRFSEAT